MSMYGGWNPVSGPDAIPGNNLNIPYDYRTTRDNREVAFIPKESLAGQSAEDIAKTYYGAILKYKYDPYLPKEDRKYFRLLASAAKKNMSDAKKFDILRRNAGIGAYKRDHYDRAASSIYHPAGFMRSARTPQERAARWRKLLQLDFNQRNAACIANGMNPDRFQMENIAPYLDDPRWTSYEAYREANKARSQSRTRARKDALSRLRAQYRGPDGRISAENAQLIKDMMRNPREVGLRNITNFRAEDNYEGMDTGGDYDF